MGKEKTRDEVVSFVQAVAGHKDWRENPDREFLNSVIDGLHANFNQYGYFLCPCRESWGRVTMDMPPRSASALRVMSMSISRMTPPRSNMILLNLFTFEIDVIT